jgi:hypothetical protein
MIHALVALLCILCLLRFRWVRAVFPVTLPPINPTLCLYLKSYVDLQGFVLYFTLGHVRRGNRCEGYTLLSVTTHAGWLKGLWPTQAKMAGIMLKATWHWDRDSSVVNDPLGN